MIRWMVTGAGGMLGRDVVAELARRGAEVTALTRADLDITDAAAVTDAVAGHRGVGDPPVVGDPLVMINTAAWTDVDGAETDEAAATRINGTGTENVAAACARAGARLLHLSTDYVFPGDGTAPYPEDAPLAPCNAYGRSKLAGEEAVRALLPTAGFVVRTAWLYGAHGRNFVSTMLRLAADREFVDVVDDQRGQPTWTGALAGHLVQLGEAAVAGVATPGAYHGTASGETTWYGLARAVFSEAGLDPRRVRPTTSQRYPRPARRPAYSVLGHQRWRAAGIAPMPDWRDTLRTALAELR